MFRLPRADIELIRGLRYREKLEFVDRAILENAHFLLKIVENPEIFGHDIDFEEYESDGMQKGSGDERESGEGKVQDGPARTQGHGHDHTAGTCAVSARLRGRSCC